MGREPSDAPARASGGHLDRAIEPRWAFRSPKRERVELDEREPFGGRLHHRPVDPDAVDLGDLLTAWVDLDQFDAWKVRGELRAGEASRDRRGREHTDVRGVRSEELHPIP